MDKSELYLIKDGDTGETVATGLQANFEKLVDNKADKSSVPTKVSQLTNDSNFITSNSANSTFATKSELGNINTILDTINGEVI